MRADADEYVKPSERRPKVRGTPPAVTTVSVVPARCHSTPEGLLNDVTAKSSAGSIERAIDAAPVEIVHEPDP